MVLRKLFKNACRSNFTAGSENVELKTSNLRQLENVELKNFDFKG